MAIIKDTCIYKYLDNVEDYVPHKNIFNFSPDILMLNIETRLLQESFIDLPHTEHWSSQKDRQKLFTSIYG